MHPAFSVVFFTTATGAGYGLLALLGVLGGLGFIPGYLIFSAMTGSVLLNALLQAFAISPTATAAAALPLTLLGWGWKLATWRYNDALEIATTANTATGLTGGTVRSLEWPHTEENY